MTSSTEKNLRYNDVQGVEKKLGNTRYTLNFDQQNYLIFILNQLQPAVSDFTFNPDKKLDFEEIIIYRFEQPNLLIKYLGTDHNGNTFFEIPQWNPKVFMLNGRINTCLNNLSSITSS